MISFGVVVHEMLLDSKVLSECTDIENMLDVYGYDDLELDAKHAYKLHNRMA